LELGFGASSAMTTSRRRFGFQNGVSRVGFLVITNSLAARRRDRRRGVDNFSHPGTVVAGAERTHVELGLRPLIAASLTCRGLELGGWNRTVGQLRLKPAPGWARWAGGAEGAESCFSAAACFFDARRFRLAAPALSNCARYASPSPARRAAPAER
jgi:hypothetical protein